MPHAAQGFVDILHNLGRRLNPTQLKQLLPNMTSVAVNNRLRDPSQQLVDHDRLVVLRDGVKRLLHHMAAKRIHREVEGIAADGLRNFDDLLRCAVLEAALDQKVTKAVNHQRIGLGHNGFDDVILLLGSPNLEFLLQEDGSLLVIVANNLVNNVLPVAADVAVE